MKRQLTLCVIIICAALVLDSCYKFWTFLEDWHRREYPIKEIPTPRTIKPASLCPHERGRAQVFIDCWSAMQTYREDI